MRVMGKKEKEKEKAGEIEARLYGKNNRAFYILGGKDSELASLLVWLTALVQASEEKRRKKVPSRQSDAQSMGAVRAVRV